MIADLFRGSAAAARILAVLGLAACADNISSGPSAPQVPWPLTLVSRVQVSPAASCTTRACIYVTNEGNNSVTVYAKRANGNIAPLWTIYGSNTGLNLPVGIALDASRNIYVTNSGANTVTVFAAGANGNVAPIRTISGGNTGLSTPWGI